MTVVVDTCFLIDVARGRPGARRMLERLEREQEALLIPSFALAEYLAGSQAPAEDVEALAQAGQIVPFDVVDAHAAGDLARTLLAEGRFPGWSDIAIAAMAHARALPVVTRNGRHFGTVPTRSYE